MAKANNGGLLDLEEWLNENPDCILVIVDTLARIKNLPGKNSGSAYDYDSASLKNKNWQLNLIQNHVDGDVWEKLTNIKSVKKDWLFWIIWKAQK